MIQIEESKMLFEFKEGQVFRIENSILQKSIGEGIKTVEFLVTLKEDEICFIEAKSSSPRPTPENKEKFDTFINEISDKFLHSFNMYLSAILKRNHYDEIPSALIDINKEKAAFKYILIIKGHKIEWLQPLKDAIYKKLLHQNKIWKNSVILMNEEIAKQYKLVKEGS
jgi:hypothetical protein